MRRTESFICGAILAFTTAQASAHLYLETCTVMSGYSHRLQCYVGYTEPQDQDVVYQMLAKCHETYPYDMYSGQVGLVVTSIPHIVTAFISVGSCPEGNYSFHPKVYFDYVPNNVPDGSIEYPEYSDTQFFVCFSNAKQRLKSSKPG